MSGECDNCGHHVVDCMCRTTPETDVIAREAVERIKNLVMTRQDADGDLWVLACDYTDLLARVEKVEAERDAAYTQGYSDAEAEISQTAMGQKIEALSKQNAEYRAHVKRLTAERDEAYRAGQDEMRERAAEAILYLARMKGIGDRTIDASEAAHLIRALPLKDRPD